MLFYALDSVVSSTSTSTSKPATGFARPTIKRIALTVACFCLLLDISVPLRAQQKVEAQGSLEGLVVGGANEAGKRTFVVAERAEAKYKIPTDTEGRFQASLKVGVYKIYVEGADDDASASVKYRLEPGKMTFVNLNLGNRSVYCTAKGERVRPTNVVPFDAKGLHRPKYYAYELKDVKPDNIVIEYCAKTEGPTGTFYRSARLLSADTNVFADNLVYDSANRAISVFDTEVVAVQHDIRISESVISLRQIAAVRNDVLSVDLTGGTVSASGRGSINSGKTRFSFFISNNSLVFEYTDSTGLRLKSDKTNCSFMSRTGNTVTFGGSATVSGSSPILQSGSTPLTVGFKIQVTDNGKSSKTRDEFVIEIPELDYYPKKGRVKGEIVVVRTKSSLIPTGITRLQRN